MATFRPRFETLTELLRQSLAEHADRPLFGERRGGVYAFDSYADFGRDVDAMRGALAKLGVGAGDRVAIIASNRPEWAVAAYATFGLGAVFVAMYDAQSEGDWEHILHDSGAKVLFVPGQVVARRIVQLRPRLPMLAHLVVLEGPTDRGMEAYALLLEDGARSPTPVATVSPDDVACFVYTSGTTGKPKGVMLSHRNIAWNVCAVHSVFPADPSDRSLSFLPWAHVFGQTVELHGMISIGGSIGIAESLEHLVDNMEEVRPTLFFGVPRVFERIVSGLERRFAAASVVERTLFERGLENARHRRQLAARRQTSGVADFRSLVFDKLVFSKIREKFGGRIRYAISGGAALPKDTAEFIDDLGITVFEGYGLSETAPIVTANYPGARKFGSVGRAIPGVRVEIDTSVTGDPKHGEILVFGHNVMLGYHGLPEESEAVFVRRGGERGIRTGDMGYVDGEGFLHITGRIKEQYKLSNGKYVVPSLLEDDLRRSPYIAHAMIYGDDREYNVAVVVPDFEALGAWARRVGLSADARALVQHERVTNLLAEEIEKHSSGMRAYERIRKFHVGSIPFTVENGMLTPSLKGKRREILKVYGDALEALYG